MQTQQLFILDAVLGLGFTRVQRAGVRWGADLRDRHTLVLAQVVRGSMHDLEAVRAKVGLTLLAIDLSHSRHALLAPDHSHLRHFNTQHNTACHWAVIVIRERTGRQSCTYKESFPTHSL